MVHTKLCLRSLKWPCQSLSVHTKSTSPLVCGKAAYFFIYRYQQLIIFGMNFKIRLWVGANRADFRRGSANHDMAAVATLPNFNLAFLEYLLGLHIFQQSAVTLLMAFFNIGNHAEFLRQLRKTLAFSSFAKEAYISVHS